MPLADTIREIENSPFIEAHEYLFEEDGPLVRQAIEESKAFLNKDDFPDLAAIKALGWPVFTGNNGILLQTAKGFLIIGDYA